MAKPPRSMAVKPASPPACFPIGVRAAETMTEPGMARSLCVVRAPILRGLRRRREPAPRAREDPGIGLGDTRYQPGQHKSVKHLVDISSRPGGNIYTFRRSWKPSLTTPPDTSCKHCLSSRRSVL